MQYYEHVLPLQGSHTVYIVEWCAWCHTLKSPIAFIMCFVGYVYLNHWPEQYILTLVTYMYIACPL